MLSFCHCNSSVGHFPKTRAWDFILIKSQIVGFSLVGVFQSNQVSNVCVISYLIPLRVYVYNLLIIENKDRI